MKPIVSIIIPTKGRVECVNALTSDLVSCAGYDSNYISITVLDNATPNALYNLPKDVFLILREEPVSAIENILSAASLSHGRYAWIIGDDDAFPCDIFLQIFELINQVEPGIIRLVHQYVETDDVIRSYEIDAKRQFSRYNYSALFDWHCFGPTSINEFEDKAGFVSANIFRADILREALRLARALVGPFAYAQNVYITKLYAVLALYLAGGYWASKEILVRQRIPLNGRYFVDNASVWFQNFVEAPAEVYRACARFDARYAAMLLTIHYSKKIDYDYLAASGVPASQCLRYAAQNLFYMGALAGLKMLCAFFFSYMHHFSSKAKSAFCRIV